MSETRGDFLERLRCSQVDFDQLAAWYWRSVQRNSRLEANLENARGMIKDMAVELMDVKKQRDDLLALVEQVEWLGGDTPTLERYTWCPWCHHQHMSGHAPDCERQAQLDRIRSEMEASDG